MLHFFFLDRSSSWNSREVESEMTTQEFFWAYERFVNNRIRFLPPVETSNMILFK